MYKRGKSWHSDFVLRGRRYRKSWGPISKTVAKEKEEKFRTKILEGKYSQKAKRILFETFSEKYIENAKLNKKPSSARRNESSINMLMPHFKGKLISSIHPFMVEQYKKARKDAGTEPATINRDVATLRNMLHKAVEWKYLSQNQLAGIKKLLFKEDNEKMWVLTPEEEKRLLAECEKRPQRKKYLKDLVMVALHTGMRQAEILKLKNANVNLNENYIKVTHTKTGKNRYIPINDTLREILERRSKREFVFTNAKGQPLTVLTNAYWTAVKEAGLIMWEGDKKIRFRFHDLRHTFGSRLGMAGTDLKTIMDIMGHETHIMAMRYQHPSPAHKLNAVKFLDFNSPQISPQVKI